MSTYFPKMKSFDKTLKDVLEKGIEYLKEWDKFKNSSKVSEKMLYYFLGIDKILKNFKIEKKKYDISNVLFRITPEFQKNMAKNLFEKNNAKEGILRISKYAVQIPLLAKNYGYDCSKNNVNDFLKIKLKKPKENRKDIKDEIIKIIGKNSIKENKITGIELIRFFELGEKFTETLKNKDNLLLDYTSFLIDPNNFNISTTSKIKGVAASVTNKIKSKAASVTNKIKSKVISKKSKDNIDKVNTKVNTKNKSNKKLNKIH